MRTLKNKILSIFLIIAVVFGAAACSKQPKKEEVNEKVTTVGEDKNKKESEDKAEDKNKVVEENKGDSKDKSSLNGKLTVHFIDVGQADSILIQQGEHSMLIDGGNNADAPLVKDYISKQGVKKIDVVVGTHAHEDHIGALDDVIDAFPVGKVYFPKQVATTKTYENFVNSVKNKGLKFTLPKVGSTFNVGDAVCTILAPNKDSYEGGNDYSIVIKLQYGNNSFLFTGDAETLGEKEILDKKLDVKADVLKVGHHGSKTSTSDGFLKAVAPKYAVISSETGNDYGHPHQVIMDRLNKAKIKIYRTDEQGTIKAVSDGNTIKFSTVK